MKTILLIVTISSGKLIVFCAALIIAITALVCRRIKNTKNDIKKRDIAANIKAITDFLQFGEGKSTIDRQLDAVKQMTTYIEELLPYVNKEGLQKLIKGFDAANQWLIELTDIDVELSDPQKAQHNQLSEIVGELFEKIERKKHLFRNQPNIAGTTVTPNTAH